MTEHMQYILAWMPSTTEWLIILIIALLIFGKRLPEIARSLGKSLTEFKKGINEAKDTKDDLANDIRHVKDDISNQTKDAAGLNDFDKNN
jgi:sec-independent protein translocase protein TatA